MGHLHDLCHPIRCPVCNQIEMREDPGGVYFCDACEFVWPGWVSLVEALAEHNSSATAFQPCPSTCDDSPASPFCTLPRGHDGQHYDEDFGVSWEFTERWFYDDRFYDDLPVAGKRGE